MSERRIAERGQADRVRIGVLSMRGTSHRVHASPYYMRMALERWAGKTTHMGDRFRLSCLGKRMAARVGRVSEATYVRRVERHQERDPQDLLIAMYASGVLARIGPSRAPLVYITDAAAHDLVESYPQYAGLSERNRVEFLRAEERAVERAELIVTHSQWSARSLIERAGATPEKVLIVPVGVESAWIPSGVEPLPIEEGATLEAVFVGRAWERKGLRQCVAAIELLIADGIRAHLTVLGCDPPAAVLGSSSTCLGSFDPDTAAGAGLLAGALSRAHVHLLPSRSECFGIAVAEAGAYCTPSIVTAVDGLPEAVQDGVTGSIISAAGSAEELAKVMSDWRADSELYMGLCRAVRLDVEERLNWDAWGEAVARVLSERVL